MIIWEEFYPDVEEEIPGSAPPRRGNPVYVEFYVDANHVGNLLTGDLIQGLLSLSIFPQSYGTVSARTQRSHQALAPNS